MSRLKLTQISRNNTRSQLLDTAEIEVRFRGERAWGKYPVAPGATINLESPPAGISASNSVGPFNTSKDELQLVAYVRWGETIVPLPLATTTTPVNPNPVPAIPLGTGERTLVYSAGNVTYIIRYRVEGDTVTATFALATGIGNAILTFLTTLATLVVNYFQSLTYLLSQALSRSRLPRNDQRDRD